MERKRNIGHTKELETQISEKITWEASVHRGESELRTTGKRALKILLGSKEILIIMVL